MTIYKNHRRFQSSRRSLTNLTVEFNSFNKVLSKAWTLLRQCEKLWEKVHVFALSKLQINLNSNLNYFKTSNTIFNVLTLNYHFLDCSCTDTKCGQGCGCESACKCPCKSGQKKDCCKNWNWLLNFFFFKVLKKMNYG